MNDLVDGDLTAVPKLHANSRSAPLAFAEEVEGNLVDLALKTLANGETTTTPKLYDDFVARMYLTAAELAGDNPSPARRLCAEAATFAWAECWLLSMKAGMAKVAQQSLESSRRQTAAMRRLMLAVRTLAQIEAAERKPRRMIDATWRAYIPSNER